MILSVPFCPHHFVRSILFPTILSKNPSKKYLEGKLSLATMYELYVEKCRQTDSDPVRVSYYRHIFDTEFNLAFHKPKKDFCNFCHKYNSSTIEEKIEIENEHAAHQSRKLYARNAKDKYKKEAQEDGEKSLVVVTFDLEAVLPSPKLAASDVYYKRKLSTYNLTVYSLATHECTCYMLHEGTAGRGSSDIASCMLKFIQKQPNTTKKLVLFSGTCGGQNRNQFFSTMIIYAPITDQP